MDARQQHATRESYGSRFLKKWLPIYLLIGGAIYLVVYLVLQSGGGGGGGGY